MVEVHFETYLKVILLYFKVNVPSELIALMSAIKSCEEAIKDDTRRCKFSQKVIKLVTVRPCP